MLSSNVFRVIVQYFDISTAISLSLSIFALNISKLPIGMHLINLNSKKKPLINRNAFNTTLANN